MRAMHFHCIFQHANAFSLLLRWGQPTHFHCIFQHDDVFLLHLRWRQVCRSPQLCMTSSKKVAFTGKHPPLDMYASWIQISEVFLNFGPFQCR